MLGAVLIVIIVGMFFSLPALKNKRQFLYRRLKCLELRSITRTPRFYFHRIGLKIMAHEPLLGSGSGGFSQHFFDYYKGSRSPEFLAAKASPHSVYLKMLSERGIYGFLAYLWLVGWFIYFGMKRTKQVSGEQKYFLWATILALFGEMVIYGLVFDPFYLRIFQLIFWIYLAFIVALAGPVIPKIPFTKKKAMVIGMVFLALLGYRLYRVKAEPISDHYEAGFYRWQVPRKGSDRRPYRLTSGHALKVFTVKKDTIRFRVCSNKPDVEKSPQVVTVYLNGKTVKKIELRDKGWHEVVIPTQLLKGKKVFMDIQVDGTWVPYRYGRGRSKRVLGVIVGRIKG